MDYEVDIYFFAPPTLGLSTSNPKISFVNSMKSYARVQFTSALDEKGLIIPERVELETQRLNDVLLNEDANVVEIINKIKNTALVYENYLKDKIKQRKNEVTVKPTWRKLNLLYKELIKTEKLNFLLRGIITKNLSSKREFPLEESCRTALSRLGDYVSFLMVDYLAHMHGHIDNLIGEENSHKVIIKLKEKLDGIAQRELELRKKIKLHVDPEATQEAKEAYIYRTGLLKKYFQKVLFIQVKSIPLAKKVFQPLAASAAGLAACWAAFFQQVQSSSSMVSKFGLTPTWLLTAGVVAYIIKDRIKELSKNFLAGKVEKVVADVEKVLIYKGQEEKSVELGRIKEYVRGIKANELSSEVYSARYAHDMSDIEAEIGEDIIHYNKKIFINKKSNKNIKNEWGLREIIRFSLSQYLQNLDDPFKEVSFIDDLGKLCRHEAHRVYYAHLAFQFSYKSPEGRLFKDVKLAKLVLDKQGLVKVTHAVQNEIYV